MTDLSEELKVEPIDKKHNVKVFDCGKDSLNTYLSRFAYKNDQSNISKTFVLIDDNDVTHGYYSICAASIEFEDLPNDLATRLPKYPIPCARLARLAITNSVKGKGMGAKLLIDALQKLHLASKEMGIKFVVVDALDEEAKEFYIHYGFQSLPGKNLTLILPIETINKLFNPIYS
jgi:predicted GNAT family N-acyltransferase